MPKQKYNCANTGIFLDRLDGEVVIHHTHSKHCFFNRAQVRGCQAYYKTYADATDLILETRAGAASAVAEDESRLSCVIL